jgi:hypothetical protein
MRPPLSRCAAGLSERQIEDAVAADRRAQDDHARVLGGDAPDAARVAAQRVRAQRPKHAIGAVGRNEGDELSLIGRRHVGRAR